MTSDQRFGQEQSTIPLGIWGIFSRYESEARIDRPRTRVFLLHFQRDFATTAVSRLTFDRAE